MSINRILMCGAAGATIAACLAAGPAWAQPAQTQAAPREVGEVMVTARRREENVQDVPAAITALSGAALQEQQIRNPTDLQATTPSLDIGGANSVFSRGMANYSIRGIGQGLFGGSSVTSYFAEAPFGPSGPAMPFFDIGSVQVLKGPQGTLFGRATAGGAVLIGPAPPTLDAFYGSVGATVGNHGRRNFDLMLNVPLVQGMGGLRIAANLTHMDGYTRNLSTGQTMDEDNSRSLRISLLLQPAEWIRNYTVYNYYDFNGVTEGRINVGANLGLANLNRTAANFAAICATAVANGLATDVATCQAQRVQILANIRSELRADIIRTTTDDPRTVTTGNTYPNREEQTLHTFINDTRITLPEWGPFKTNIRNILSLQLGRGVVNGNFSGTTYDLNASAFALPGLPGTGVSQAQYINGRIESTPGEWTRLITNEIQLNGSVYNDALIWILGYYYQNAPTTPATAGSTNLNRTFGGVGTANLGPISATSMPIGGHSLERAYFGQATLDFGFIGLRGLHLTGGYRRTSTEVVSVTLPTVISLTSGLVLPGSPASTAITTGSGPGYTISVDYRLNPDFMVYATRRRGYKPGGLNVIPGASAVPGFVPSYLPESVIDTEIGVHWDFRFDSVRGRINADMFRDDYTNIQRGVNAITPAGQNIAFTANVAEARIEGWEVEGFLVFDRWRLNATYSHIRSDYTRWIGADPLGAAPAGTNIDLSNNPFANAPENKFSVTLSYDLPINPDYGEMQASLTVFGQDRSWLSDNAQRYLEVYGNDPNVFTNGVPLRDVLSDPGFTAANIRLDWNHVMGHRNLDATLFVRNVTDELYAYAGSVALQSLGYSQKIYSQPRMFGVEVTYRFGD